MENDYRIYGRYFYNEDDAVRYAKKKLKDLYKTFPFDDEYSIPLAMKIRQLKKLSEIRNIEHGFIKLCMKTADYSEIKNNILIDNTYNGVYFTPTKISDIKAAEEILKRCDMSQKPEKYMNFEKGK